VKEADIHDAAQDVFIVVLRRLEEFEGRSTLRRWLYGICVHTALTYRRKGTGRREALMSSPPELESHTTPEAELEHERARAALFAALEELDENQRAVFVLYEVERLSMKEVAEVLGCPLQTAYYRHQAARRHVLARFPALNSKEEA
jgi:RNA polymerase sigma-70 factor (ECF subfamily)